MKSDGMSYHSGKWVIVCMSWRKWWSIRLECLSHNLLGLSSQSNKPYCDKISQIGKTDIIKCWCYCIAAMIHRHPGSTAVDRPLKCQYYQITLNVFDLLSTWILINVVIPPHWCPCFVSSLIVVARNNSIFFLIIENSNNLWVIADEMIIDTIALALFCSYCTLI